jgi:hypothetical protein
MLRSGVLAARDGRGFFIAGKRAKMMNAFRRPALFDNGLNNATRQANEMITMTEKF